MHSQSFTCKFQITIAHQSLCMKLARGKNEGGHNKIHPLFYTEIRWNMQTVLYYTLYRGCLPLTTLLYVQNTCLIAYEFVVSLYHCMYYTQTIK